MHNETNLDIMAVVFQAAFPCTGFYIPDDADVLD